MAEIVDSIVAELIARDNGYISTFDRAINKHKEFSASVPKIDGIEVLSKGAKQYADQHSQSLGKVVKDEEQASQRITSARKKRVAEAKASDEAEVASAKRAAKAKADAEIAESERSARYRRLAERAVTNRTIPAGSGHIPNADLSRGGASAFIPAAALAGAGEAEELKEVDYLTRDIALNKARLAVAEGKEAETLQREIIYLETINRLKKAGVEETEAIALAEAAAAKSQQAHGAGLFRRSATRGGLGELNQFALGASRGRFGYSFTPGAVAGIGAAIGGAVAIGAIDSATKYGQALSEVSEQAGLSAESLQVYQHAAQQAGVENDQFNSALQTLAENLGKARTGSKEQGKAFAAIGVDIHTAATAGDLLPTLIDRISSIPDAAKRARVETALFGSTGEKLDSMLSGGNERINELAKALGDTGAVLSSSDIARLDDTSKKLAEVKAELAVDIAQVVAGNADAIERLASSFASLADKIPGALSWLDRMSNRVDVAGGWFQTNILAPAASQAGLLNLADHYRVAGIENMRYGGNKLGRDALHGGINGNAAVGQDLLSSVLHPATVQAGGVNNTLLDKLGAGNGRKGPSASTLERQALARERRFQDQLARYQDEQLREQESLTGDISKRADIERQLADRELARQNADIDNQTKRDIAQGGNAKVAQQRAAQLKEEAKRAHDLAVQNIEQQKGFDLARAQADTNQRILNATADHLRNELQLANTSAERRRIELELLANAKEQERVRLNGIIASNPADSHAATEAQAQLKTLGARYDDQRAGVIRDTETSLEAYRRSLEVTADTISDFGVHVLQDFNSELDHSITKALHLHGIFGEIVGDLIDMEIKQQIIAPAANSGGFAGFLGSIGKLFGLGSAAGGASGAAGVLGSGFDVGSIATDIPFAFASGGSGIIGGRPGVDQNVLSINGSPVAKVGRGELLSVSPNAALSNQRLAAPAPQQNIVVVQPITADFRGARTDEQTMREFAAYADARSRQAYEAAVATAGSQVGGIMQRQQTLGN